MLNESDLRELITRLTGVREQHTEGLEDTEINNLIKYVSFQRTSSCNIQAVPLFHNQFEIARNEIFLGMFLGFFIPKLFIC